MSQSKFVIGIDATNLQAGGGITHLIEFLNAGNLLSHQFKAIYVWGSNKTLEALPSWKWLHKMSFPHLNSGYISRFYWQKYILPKIASKYFCSILFVPGGSLFCHFFPTVVMCRNLIPFESKELNRYFVSKRYFKFILLKYIQKKSFLKADGVIFLTNYARNCILGSTQSKISNSAVINHGVNCRFKCHPKPQKQINLYTFERPFQIVYVSPIDLYKHQFNVVEAIYNLRKDGYPVTITLIGSKYYPAYNKLITDITRFKNWPNFCKICDVVSHADMHNVYTQFDMAIFASSCENMPNILLEKMSSGLPLASSNLGPMPEILGNSGSYFNPEKSQEIYIALKTNLDSEQLRDLKANSSYNLSLSYSWEKCAEKTIDFLKTIAHESS